MSFYNFIYGLCGLSCRYVVRVSDLMKISKLPRPRKKLLDSDGSKLKLITVECEV